MVPDISQLQEKLAELRHRDPQFGVFGSSKHRYILNPCLSEEQLEEAEVRYDIALPEDYRRFLLFMGNGGAGPNYGIFRLEESLEHSVNDVHLLREPFPHVQDWNLTAEELGLDPDRDCGAFDQAYFKDANAQGALKISHEGCAYYAILVIAGRERGHIWWDGRAGDGGIRPQYRLRESEVRLSFIDWYELWLNTSLEKVR